MVLLKQFSNTIEFLKTHRKKDFNSAKPFSILIEKINELSKKVYLPREKETTKIISSKPHMLKISTFELMEHNFRENSHSNVLQYILDYDFTNNAGVEILYNLINKEKNGIPDFYAKLKSKSYTIEREKSTGKGRIDLFILDMKNKWVIIIENKIFATVNEYMEDGDEEKVIKNQLDHYREYTQTQYPNFNKMFFVLSYRKIEENYAPYCILNYNDLYQAINSTSSKDPIIRDYQLLIHSLIKQTHNKSWLIKEARKLEENEKLSLNTLELINKLLL